MRRRKLFIIRRVALGLAIAAIVPTTALAKPVPLNQDVEDRGQYQLGPGEIPYYSQLTVQDQVMELGLSEGKINALGLGIRGQSSDDRAVTRAMPVAEVPTWAKQIEAPYLRVTDVGSVGSDDRSLSKATPVDSTPVVSVDDGSGIDFSPYTVTGFGIAFLLAIGMGFAVWHSRRTRLTPA